MQRTRTPVLVFFSVNVKIVPLNLKIRNDVIMSIRNVIRIEQVSHGVSITDGQSNRPFVGDEFGCDGYL